MTMFLRKCVVCLTGLIMQIVITNSAPAAEHESEAVPIIWYGTEVKIEDYPFFAATDVCGGTILSDRWILTAAHCVDTKERIGNSIIYVGGERKQNSIRHKYNKPILHPNYNPKTLAYDLALLQLETPLKFSSKVKPAKLPKSLTSSPQLVFIGRGKDETHQMSSTLKKMDFLKMSPEDCKATFHSHKTRHFDDHLRDQNVICGKRVEGGPGACHGDSGSPLLENDTIIGVASFIVHGPGRRTCKASDVSGYTNVAAFLPWITTVTGLK